MASIYLHKNTGTYYAKYTNTDGKRVSKNTGTKKKREAKVIASGYEADERDNNRKAKAISPMFAPVIEQAAREAANGELTMAKAQQHIKRIFEIAHPDQVDTTLEKYWTRWIADQKRHVSPETYNGYNDDLALFAKALGKSTMSAPVGSLKKDQIVAAMEKAIKQGAGKGRKTRKASTVNKALSSLRRVMDSAVNDDLAGHNPAKLTRKLKQKDSTEKAPFTVEEIRKMIDHTETPEEWRGAILIAAHTGLRMKDVANLNRKHIDGTRIVIQPSKTSRINKIAIVPLSPPCLTWLAKCKRKTDLFPHIKAMAAPKRSMQFDAIMSKSKVPKAVEMPGGIEASRSFHALRHTFISWLAEADVQKDVRQKLASHSTGKMHDIYTHHDKALTRAIAKLPDL